MDSADFNAILLARARRSAGAAADSNIRARRQKISADSGSKARLPGDLIWNLALAISPAACRA